MTEPSKELLIALFIALFRVEKLKRETNGEDDVKANAIKMKLEEAIKILRETPLPEGETP